MNILRLLAAGSHSGIMNTRSRRLKSLFVSSKKHILSSPLVKNRYSLSLAKFKYVKIDAHVATPQHMMDETVIFIVIIVTLRKSIGHG